ncbi:general secretion pathway protein GspB [Pseudomarimonas arenosa]|uniref:General secretion pathway protein GspB n=1 Tax=Pseudomarimonas arenosa TaxID=2774145 RepID=A0AAW3ZFN8_9GAMM|nr:general secretion pathway protein GspB [Pseudomarimonas arenosa]MBD8524300.1 general secretion pathway protein GspB [Pseudomarimonas arenosa]
MSLILEALRKSESERQMGQPPGLMSQAAQAADRQRRSTLPLWLGSAAAVLVIGTCAWWIGTQSRTATEPAVQAEQTGTVPDGQLEASGSATTEVDARRPQTVAQPAQEAPAPRAATVPAPTPPQPVVASSAPATKAAAESPPPQVTAAAPTTSAPTTAEAATTEPTTPAPPAAASPPPTLPPDIDLMPAAERSALPPLKLSVHVYHAQADRRFAVIDGRRVLEGSDLGQQVSVQSIEREGVWLRINGRSWWLPR